MGSSRFGFDSGSGPGNSNVFFVGRSGGAALAFPDGGGTILSTEDGSGVGGSKRRTSFFSSPEELIYGDDLYYDEQLSPEKKRRLTPEQVHILETSFEKEIKLEPERKMELAKKLGLQPRQVAVWFQNRRARWKNKQLEQEFCNLKSLYDTLRVDHDCLLQNNDSLLADNHRLRSEVMSLTEKLQEIKNSSGAWNKQLGNAGDVPEGNVEVTLASPMPESTEVDLYGAPLVVDSTDVYYTEVVEDGTSFHGGCQFTVTCEDYDGSDDGGVYFPGVFSENSGTVEWPANDVVSDIDRWVWS